MKNLSEEQKAQRDERKSRMKEFAGIVAKMSLEERSAMAARYPIMTIEGRALSTVNQCLVAIQIPAASVVGGFRQWIKAGRAVMKGQHGAAIWVPLMGGKTQGQGEESNEPTATAGRRCFILGTIFDISQTQEIQAGAADEINAGIVEHCGELATA